MRESILEMNTKLNDIKVTTEKLCMDQNNLKSPTLRIEKNIIIVGLQENKNTSKDMAKAYDLNQIITITNQLVEGCPKPEQVFRLGTENETQHRKTKVCFNSSEIVKLLLRNKHKLPQGIKMFSDQTPAQSKYFPNHQR
ncbi:hypothetical protein ACJJTC_009259 [Scirpophaga incertulas]